MIRLAITHLPPGSVENGSIVVQETAVKIYSVLVAMFVLGHTLSDGMVVDVHALTYQLPPIWFDRVVIPALQHYPGVLLREDRLAMSEKIVDATLERRIAYPSYEDMFNHHDHEHVFWIRPWSMHSHADQTKGTRDFIVHVILCFERIARVGIVDKSAQEGDVHYLFEPNQWPFEMTRAVLESGPF
jgi:hypothetical protein